jgi:hypothetical protein
MQQGEVSTGVDAQTFDYKPFNPDGTINYDSQQVTFTVSFNRPTDYDFSTGIMNVNSAASAPKETFAYIATFCKNTFSKGQFTQELSGSLLPLGSNLSASANTTSRVAPSTTTTDSRAANAGTGTESPIVDDGSHGYAIQDETGQTSNIRKNEYGDLYYPADAQPATPQPAAAPNPATSNGPLLNLTTDLTKPVTFGGVNLTNPLTLNPNATGQTLVAQPGVNTPPQKMNKEF